MLKIDHIHQLINKYFELKVRPWQVSILINIMQKKNVYIIASTNASKNLVYQVIPIITRSFIWIILPTIALMEDQIRISSKYCL